MTDTAVIENAAPEQLDEEIKKLRKEKNQQQKDLDDKEKKHRTRFKVNIIIIATLAALIIIMVIVKYMAYFRPEKIKNDKNVQMISEVNPDTSNLQVMPFNEDLTAACQPLLIADSRDNMVQLDFICPEQCRMLVRAEIFTKKENLGNKKCKLWWTEKFSSDEESLVRIGATGWVRPGEMIGKLKLDEIPTKMSDVTVRFSAVNPANEKISGGEFSMNTVMHIVDYQGNMLDENGNWVKAG